MNIAYADDMTFWKYQEMEHMLFLYLGIVEEEIKQQAYNFYNEWKGNVSMDLINRSLNFHNTLKNILDSSRWIGWISYEFVDHITEELEYFRDKMQGIVYTCEKEVEFWNDVNADHALMTGQMLDLTEEQLRKEVFDIGLDIENVKSEMDMFLAISMRYGDELDNFHKHIKDIKPRSIIHPLLLDHVIREGERGNAIIAKCMDKGGEIRVGQAGWPECIGSIYHSC